MCTVHLIVYGFYPVLFLAAFYSDLFLVFSFRFFGRLRLFCSYLNTVVKVCAVCVCVCVRACVRACVCVVSWIGAWLVVHAHVGSSSFYRNFTVVKLFFQNF